MYSPDSPASMSIHEEATIFAEGPMMGVFNNLVMYDPVCAAKQSAVDCARSGHRLVLERGRDRIDNAAARKASRGMMASPFTAKDVQCTWDMLTGQVEREATRQSPQILVRETSAVVTAYGDHEVTFHLKRAAAGFCRVARLWVSRRSIPATCRRAICAAIPIGTGPFKIR